MFTTSLVIALASFMNVTASEEPSWQADYGSAQWLAQEERKPLAVFVGSGEAGWELLSKEQELGKEIKQRLAKDYICVYVDTAEEAGKELAYQLEVADGLGLIVSDVTGRYQAFRHEGDLPSEQLLGYLGRYADQKRVARTTETYATEPASSYAPSFRFYYQPVQYSLGFSVGSRSC